MVDSFFRLQQLEPFWIDIRTLSNAGKLDAETGRWDGFIGMVGTTSRCSHHGVSSVLTVQVGYGEADLGLRGSGHCDQERSKVVLCSPGISYHINYWSVPAALPSSALDMSGQVDQGAGALHPPLQHPPHLHAPGVGVRPGLHARRGRGAGDGPLAGGRGEARPAQPRPLPAEVTWAG